jgi:hypothetical protein
LLNPILYSDASHFDTTPYHQHHSSIHQSYSLASTSFVPIHSSQDAGKLSNRLECSAVIPFPQAPQSENHPYCQSGFVFFCLTPLQISFLLFSSFYIYLGASIICTQFPLSSLFFSGGKHHLHPISSLFLILFWGQASFALIFHFLFHVSSLISPRGAGLGASILCTHSLTFTFPPLAPNHPLPHLIKPKLTSQIFESFV